MKKTVAIISVAAVLLLSGYRASAQENVKTGMNFGPLPAIAYDADKGFQYGAILQLFNYGDGNKYPNYYSKWYFETSWFTKGSKLYNVMYDNTEMFPGVRLSASVKYTNDKACDFYGFNGYQSNYDYSRIDLGKDGGAYPFHPFYRLSRQWLDSRVDFIGKFNDNLHWIAGYHLTSFKQGAIDYESINKGKDADKVFPETQPTLLQYYHDWGLISDQDFDGGLVSALRLGLEYDTRDKEGAPSRGVWTEAHVSLAPKWLGSETSFYRYSLKWMHYLPIIPNDKLTFAYRLMYEGTFGKNVPYYALPFVSVVGVDTDMEGMTSVKTVRGIMRARTVGLDAAVFNAELRWRFVQFQLFKQNIAFAFNAFTDGSMVTRGMDLTYKPVNPHGVATKALYDKYVLSSKDDLPHISFGGGLRFIMNENFIVSLEYGTPLSHYLKNSSIYNQDGTGAMYINLGYLF